MGRFLHPDRRTSSGVSNRTWIQRDSIRSGLHIPLVHLFSTFKGQADVSVGTFLGFLLNFAQDVMYKRNVATKGVEARLYGALFAGPGLAVGCIIFGLTAIQFVHWIAPCVGLVIILSTSYSARLCSWDGADDSVGIHDLPSLFRLSFRMLWFPRFIRCCGHVVLTYPPRVFFPIVYQSSQSLLHTTPPTFSLGADKQMFDTLTPRWSLFMMGCIAALLAPIPYIAFFKGPWIRERSPYSRILMAEEKKRVELEAGMQDKEARDVEMQRQEDGEAELGNQVMEEEAREKKRSHQVNTPSRFGQETWDSSATLSDHRP